MDSSNQVAEWEVRASLGGRLMVSRSASRHRGGSVPEPLTDIFEASTRGQEDLRAGPASAASAAGGGDAFGPAGGHVA
eukprot:274074-Pyramimonas_sp.AAC.2